MPSIEMNGETVDLLTVSKMSGVPRTTVYRRYKEGCRTYEALTQPVNERLRAEPRRSIPTDFSRLDNARKELRASLRSVTNSMAVSRIREALLILNTLSPQDFH